jgi:hypothetical protein
MHLFPNTQSLPMHLNIFSELYIYLSHMFKSVFTLKKGYFSLNNEKKVRSLNKKIVYDVMYRVNLAISVNSNSGNRYFY